MQKEKMTKWKVEFEGDNNEYYLLEIQIHARDMYQRIGDAQQFIRSQLKYNDELSESEQKRLEELREILNLPWDE